MTFAESCRFLSHANIDEPETDVRLLLESFFGISETDLRLHPDRDFDEEQYIRALHRRASHEPLQYILGQWDFYRQHYRVSPDCLIPRSDTEVLVDLAIRLLPEKGHFADLCTGSGCIAISLLAERPDATGVGVDLHEGALKIAEENAVINNVSDRLVLQKGDVLSSEFSILSPKPVMILCNPPYIPTRVIPTLSEEVKKEPITALDGGEDGLTFYRKIIPSMKNWLVPGGKALFEIGYDQSYAVSQIAVGEGYRTETFRDLGGNDRIILIET